MYVFLVATCFLLTFQAHAKIIYTLTRDASYNPCVSGSGVYFYPDPTNPHRYYQCDGSGKSYLQTCASDLVWDDLITACNYASAVAPAAPSSGGGSSSGSSSGGGSPSPPDDSSETETETETPSSGGSSSGPDDSSETPSGGSSQPSSGGSSKPPSSGGSHPGLSGPQISFPNPPSQTGSASGRKPSSSGSGSSGSGSSGSSSSGSSSSSSSSSGSGSSSSSSSSSGSSSLCKPVNPCGDHGECIESPATSSNKRRRFACICEEDWFGRLCDKQSSGFSTPGPRTHLDQITNNTLETGPFSLPISNEKDEKYIFYGLNGNNKVEPMNHLNKRMMDPELESEEAMD